MTARTAPPAITPAPGAAGRMTTRPAPCWPITSCGIVEPVSGTETILRRAPSTALRTASDTSFAFPVAKPTFPCPSPTATRALKEKRRPPFTTFATRLIATTFSTRSEAPSPRPCASPPRPPRPPSRPPPDPPGPPSRPRPPEPPPGPPRPPPGAPRPPPPRPPRPPPGPPRPPPLRALPPPPPAGREAPPAEPVVSLSAMFRTPDRPHGRHRPMPSRGRDNDIPRDRIPPS